MGCGTRWERALALLAALGARADLYSHNAALAACVERWRRALAVLAAMEAAGQEPDRVSLATCVLALERAANFGNLFVTPKGRALKVEADIYKVPHRGDGWKSVSNLHNAFW